MGLIGWALRDVRPYRRSLGMLTALASFEIVLRLLLPWPMKAVVDTALGAQTPPGWLLALPGVRSDSRPSLLIAIVALGLAIQMAHQAVLMVHSRLYSRTGHLITRDLRQRLFMHLQAMSCAIMPRRRLANRCTGWRPMPVASSSCCSGARSRLPFPR